MKNFLTYIQILSLLIPSLSFAGKVKVSKRISAEKIIIPTDTLQLYIPPQYDISIRARPDVPDLFVIKPEICTVSARNRFQSDFLRDLSGLKGRLENARCAGHFEERNSNFKFLGELTESNCQESVNCSDIIDSLSSVKDYKESLDKYVELFNAFNIQKNIEESIHELVDEDSSTRKMRMMIAFMKKMPAKYQDKIHFCPKLENRTKCIDNLDIDNNLVQNVMLATSAKLLNESTSDALMAYSSDSKTTDFGMRRTKKDQSMISRFTLMSSITTDLSPNSPRQTALKRKQHKGELGDEMSIMMSLVDSSLNEEERGWNDYLYEPGRENQDFLLGTIRSAYATVKPKNEADLNKFIDIIVNINKNADSYVDPILEIDDKFLSRNEIKAAIKNLNLSDADFELKNAKQFVDKINNFRVNLANKVFADHCDEAVLNGATMCKKLSNNIASLDKLKDRDILTEMQNYIDNNKDKFKFSPELLKSYKDQKDDIFRKYLNQKIQDQICISKFGNKIINGSINGLSEDERLQKRSQVFNNASNNLSTMIQDYSEKESTSALERLANDKSEKGRMMAQDFINRSGINVREGLFSSASNLNSNKELAIVQVKQPENKFDPSIQTNKDVKDSKNISSSQYLDPKIMDALERRNSIGKSASEVNPANGMTTVIGNSNFDAKVNDENKNTANLQSKIDELQNRQNEMRKKMDSNAKEEIANKANKEVSELQSQIDSLKKELKDKNTATIPTKSDGTNPNAVATDLSAKRQDLKFKPNGEKLEVDNSATTNTVGKNNNRVTKDETSIDNTRYSTNQVAGANNNLAGNTINEKASGASAAIVSGAIPKAGEGKAFGLVMTKTGELSEDQSSAIENPIDSDLKGYANKSNGRPFLIKENGEFVRVEFEVDQDGKPLIENGKLKFKKVKIGRSVANVKGSKKKDDVATLEDKGKESLIPDLKSLKDPTRLRDLKNVTDNLKK